MGSGQSRPSIRQRISNWWHRVNERPVPAHAVRTRRSSSADGRRSSYRRTSRALSTDTRSLEEDDDPQNNQRYVFVVVQERLPPPNQQYMSRHYFIIPYDQDMTEAMASVITALTGAGESNMTYEQMLELDENDFEQEFARGVSPERIERELPVQEYESELPERCTICLLEFKRGCQYRTLPCHHSYHSDCIEHWLMRKNECPVCRQRALS